MVTAVVTRVVYEVLTFTGSCSLPLACAQIIAPTRSDSWPLAVPRVSNQTSSSACKPYVQFCRSPPFPGPRGRDRVCGLPGIRDRGVLGHDRPLRPLRPALRPSPDKLGNILLDYCLKVTILIYVIFQFASYSTCGTDIEIKLTSNLQVRCFPNMIDISFSATLP